MQFGKPIHGHCDAEVYGVVVPVQLSFCEITCYVEFDRRTGKLIEPIEAHREVTPGILEPFDAAPTAVLRQAEAIARQFAGNALPVLA